MPGVELFVVGASAGGLDPLRRIVGGLPADFASAVCVVLHTSPQSPGYVPEILAGASELRTRHPRPGEAIEPGSVYVAPPNHHLVIDKERRLRLGTGPKENGFRPAIDPLFKSAALAFDGSAAGIILSGGLDDGVAGLVAIKASGGAAIVQDPDEAVVPSMPLAALAAMRPDFCLRAQEMARIMTGLAAKHVPAARMQEANGTDLEQEVGYSTGEDTHLPDLRRQGSPSLLTCPECHGALVSVRNAFPPRFRCHTGHGFTAASLLNALRQQSEHSLWIGIRTLEEYAELLEHFIDRHVADFGEASVLALKKQAARARERSTVLRTIAKDGVAEDEETRSFGAR